MRSFALGLMFDKLGAKSTESRRHLVERYEPVFEEVYLAHIVFKAVE